MQEINKKFLEALDDAEKTLTEMSFKRYDFKAWKYAYFVQYKREATIVEFLFGPPEYHVEMMIYSVNGKFGPGDIVQIPAVSKWIDEHRSTKESESREIIKEEMLWWMELLKVTLPIVEGPPFGYLS